MPPADLQRLEQAIADSHAFDDPDPDLGMPGVMDAGSTVVRGLGPDGTPVELDAYALGLGGTDELSDDQKELRRTTSTASSTRADGDRARRRLLLSTRPNSSRCCASTTRRRRTEPLPSRSVAGTTGRSSCSPRSPTTTARSRARPVTGTDVVPVLEAAESNPEHSWRDADGTEFMAVVRIALPGITPCSD